ncbi:hypothetical protein [Hymenobacter weizhouensis]|uniref:hypothetical protein n=1 Tax=Hymenobacter sp. YIM 151500-1 TaxID=2987689 RepID=UPI0022272D2C|nr:hypothetical protein [Hymenobacter sp. YIM 151500-1]UYZ64053.1 hypothetical protein OIS53_04200 [Hymenobacter sp. YIM 151500-1]
MDEQLAMHFDNKTSVKMLFQSQFREASVIEVEFQDVVQFNWCQSQSADSGMTVLMQAVCFWKDNTLYWAEDIDWSLEGLDRNDYRWIAAKNVRWRIIEAALGPDPRLLKPVN